MEWDCSLQFSSLLFNRQCRFARSFVFLCKELSRCDIHPVTADTAVSAKESTTDTKIYFYGQKYHILTRCQNPCQSSSTQKITSIIWTNHEMTQRKKKEHSAIEVLIQFMRRYRSTPLKWRHLIGGEEEGCGQGADIFCVESALGPITPDALLSSPAMFAAPRTRSLALLGCTLSLNYFCYSNSCINYALE